MQIPEVLIDSYREQDIAENRKVREYTRETSDTTNPVLIEFYQSGNSYVPIEPFIANAVKLNYSANSFINAAKTNGLYSYFIVFIKNGDEDLIKYINAVEKTRDLDTLVKNIIENNCTILTCEEVELFSDYDPEPPQLEYEELVATAEIQLTKDTIPYVDEPFTCKCYITYSAGQNDWYPYRYYWNLSSSSREEIEVQPIEFANNVSELKRNVTCDVVFRLKEQPGNDSIIRTVKAASSIKLYPIPMPEEMYADIVISCPESADFFVIDNIYRVTASIANLGGGYRDWTLSTIDWQVTVGDDKQSIPLINDNIYEASFTPTREGEYTITATAYYVSTRNPAAKPRTFKGTYIKNASYGEIEGSLDVIVGDGTVKQVFVGETVELHAQMRNIYKGEYWTFQGFTWQNAVRESDLNTSIAKVSFYTTMPVNILCEATYVLKTNPTVKKVFTKNLFLEPIQLSNMSCYVYLEYQKDVLYIGDTIEITARLRNVLNDGDWGEGTYRWEGATSYDKNVAYFEAKTCGFHPIICYYTVKDKYGRDRTLEFTGSFSPEVKYPLISIGELTISRDIELPYKGDNVTLNASYDLTYDSKNWDLMSVAWRGNVVTNKEWPATMAKIVDISMSEVVTCVCRFQHKIYADVQREISAQTVVPTE